MATLILQAAGSVVGTLVGGPFVAMIGQAAGAVAGSLIDRALFGASGGRNSVGPRLTRLPGTGASEGVPVARVYGRARVGGALIWMTRFEEEITVQRQGGAGGKGGSRPRAYEYKYYGNFAIGICEGPVAEVRRIWADGVELDRTKYTIRIYNGEEAQPADPLIVAKEGAANAPAYRGLCYAVFERMPLADFGNRVPQFSFEAIKPVAGLNEMVRAMCIIPGSSEFAYRPHSSSGVNRHVLTYESDWIASLEALQSLCPNLRSVALVVSWFGDDLRAGACKIAPRVENANGLATDLAWSVAGLGRASATPVSTYDGKSAYGGTPDDESLKATIADLKERGLEIVFYPFVMMDIPHDNALTDPWTGADAQPAYPWRGRITCDPAPGTVGTVDNTAAAASQIASFFGSDAPGEAEWSYRRFIFHYANLCVAAEGVDAFLIGSELIGLTRVRSASGVYPAVQALQTLAEDVKAILGAQTKISYAADWTEYGAHVVSDVSEVRFPLDVLWASPAIDFVGIDVYWPLSDWRDGADHLDAQIADSIYDLDYLRSRMRGGEGWEWYYADDHARIAQTRLPITDGAYGKHWTFRPKDLAGWWSNAHVERVGGVELSSPSPWIAQGKPVWIVEAGCPAVDRGANAPNAFPDAKSSEGRLPWFSRGFRDDLMQARMLEAFISHFAPDAATFSEAANPVSQVYGGRMVDVQRIHLWAWDARPFPAFPQQKNLWADSLAWNLGHWLNGRLESADAGRLVRALAAEVPSLEDNIASASIDAMLDGYLIEQTISPREAIEPLAAFLGFDGVLSSGSISFVTRSGKDRTSIPKDDLISRRDGGLFQLTRAQESELSRQIAVNFHDGETDYRVASVASRRTDGGSQRDSALDLSLVTTRAEARRRADIMLQDLWVARETIEFELPPSYAFLEIGDSVELDIDGQLRPYRIQRLTQANTISISARAIEASIYDHAPPRLEQAAGAQPLVPGKCVVDFLDLAIVRGDAPALQFLAVSSDPWPGAVAVWRAEGSGSYAFLRLVELPAIAGETLQALTPGIVARFDRPANLIVKLDRGALSSASELAVLAGRNAMAIDHGAGRWEIFSFIGAELLSAGTWRLSGLLRGLGGAEYLAGEAVASGARVVLLDQAVVPLTSDVQDLGKSYAYKIGPADRDYAHASYIDASALVTGLMLKPYAPVRAHANRTAEGVEIGFFRRARYNADAWDPIAIPLGEENERYEVDIYSGAQVVRTLAGSNEKTLYAHASELADFGSQQPRIDVAIHQMSATVGRGFPLRITLDIG